MALSPKERQARHAAKMRADGYTRVTLWVPMEGKAAVVSYARNLYASYEEKQNHGKS